MTNQVLPSTSTPAQRMHASSVIGTDFFGAFHAPTSNASASASTSQRAGRELLRARVADAAALALLDVVARVARRGQRPHEALDAVQRAARSAPWPRTCRRRDAACARASDRDATQPALHFSLCVRYALSRSSASTGSLMTIGTVFLSSSSSST